MLITFARSGGLTRHRGRGPLLAVCACGCACSLRLSAPAWADPPNSTAEETTPSTVIPPRLLAQVQLEYPEAALQTGEHGDVSVLVDVDREGQVVDARVESGPEVFRESALEAAMRLSFSPATRDGEAVGATTRVRFHFAPPAEEGDEPDAVLVVHSAGPDLEDTRARTTLDEAAIERAAGDDLAETVAQVPGVRMARGTADAAKPIIRGQHERRLLVLYDGVRHESQKWGPDHATEIDPFSAGSISVVRGAAGARYGPDAIGGVILVEPPPLRREPGIGGKLVSSFASNGLRPYTALRLDAAPASLPGLSLRVEGNAAISANRSAPTYVLGNTASRTGNLGGTVGYGWDAGRIRASWHHHAFRAGVFYGVSNSNPADFEAQLEAERPVTADLWSTTYAIDRPYQDVSHDIGMLGAELFGGWGSLELTYAFQLNRRQEFEQVREAVSGPQYDFTLRTHSLDGLYQHPAVELSFGSVEGGFGLQASFQESVYRGYSLLPNYRSFGGGLFAYERLSLARVDLELGARVDGLSRVAFMSDDDYGNHVRRGTLDESSCTDLSTAWRCPAAYDTGSFSVGLLAHVVPDRIDLKLDLSTASRFPDVDELYLVGSAPSFPVYALGSPDLGVETAQGATLTGGLRHEAIELELSGFGQRVDDYIYFAPDLNDEGEPRFEVTIQGTWPRYTYQPIDAVLYGLDGSISLAPDAPLGLDARGALVRAQDRASGAHLIGTPPDQLHLGLVGRPPPAGALHGTEIRVMTEIVARQARVDDRVDFAPAPPGYALIGLAAETALEMKTPLRVGLEVRNLLNTSYREYTSLLRYYADQPGRDVRVRIGMDL